MQVPTMSQSLLIWVPSLPWAWEISNRSLVPTMWITDWMFTPQPYQSGETKSTSLSVYLQIKAYIYSMRKRGTTGETDQSTLKHRGHSPMWRNTNAMVTVATPPFHNPFNPPQMAGLWTPWHLLVIMSSLHGPEEFTILCPFYRHEE